VELHKKMVMSYKYIKKRFFYILLLHEVNCGIICVKHIKDKYFCFSRKDIENEEKIYEKR